jgi:hypothetical protein
MVIDRTIRGVDEPAHEKGKQDLETVFLSGVFGFLIAVAAYIAFRVLKKRWG